MDKNEITISLFTPDPWEHVCPVVRYVGPVEFANWRLLRGNEWKDSQLQVDLDVIKDSDIIIIQRDFPRFVDICEAVIENARLYNKPIIYEIDDLLTELPHEHPDYEHYRSALTPILGMIGRADGITCPTALLQNYLLQFNENVKVLPNYLNDKFWKLLPPSKKANQSYPIVIGYMGSRSHVNDLAIIAPVLSNILNEFGDEVLFRSWGTPFSAPLIDKANAEYIDLGLVCYREFSAYFSRQRCDILIAPLVDNHFNRCKSALKFLEYSALGVPGVFSHIQPYSSVVKNGENGILATTDIEWYESLTTLIRSPDLRYSIGKTAYETLCNSYLLSKEIPNWKEGFEELLKEIKLKIPSRTTTSLVKKFVEYGREDRQEIIELKAKLEEQKQVISSFSSELNEKQRIISSLSFELERISRDLGAITQSSGWHLLKILYHIRLKIAPHRSQREKVLAKGKQILGALYRLISNFIKARALGDTQVSSLSLSSRERENIIFALETTLPVQSPAIAVLVEKAAYLPVMDETVVFDWIRTQTLKGCQIVIWDRETQIAKIRDHNGEKVQRAKNLEELCNFIRPGYICVASNDLIKQHATYLEENLVALASHNLLFTLNVNGFSDWPVRHIEQGCLPGNRINPFLRAVVKKDYIRNNYSLDLPKWKNAQLKLPAIAGRLLHHTTSMIDPEVNIPMETSVVRGNDEAQLRVHHNYIILDDKNSTESAILEFPLHLPELFMSRETDVDSRPTVFLLQPFLAIGGAENLAIQIIKQLRQLIRFVVISIETLSETLGTTSDNFRELTPFVYNFADFLEPPLYFSYMCYLIERFQPHTYYIHNGATWLFDTLHEIKKRYSELRIVAQVYDSEIGWINRIDEAIVEQIDAYIGCNTRICNAFMSRGVHSDKVFLIPHGVEISELNPENYSSERITTLKQEFGIEPEKRVVTFASRLHPQKRPLDFVELARRFSGDPTVTFLMVGDGPLAKEIDQQIQRIQIKNIIRRPFYRPISNVLAITNVLVLPSEFEGMPLIVAEAQAMGKPVVVTDVGNNKEILEMTSGGVVTEVGDVSGLMNGVRKMLEHPPDPSKVRNIIIQNFSIETVVPKYIEALLGSSHKFPQNQ